MAKPTRPFGYIAFSRDGRVKPVMSTLGTEKPDQEREVGERFAEKARDFIGEEAFIRAVQDEAHPADFQVVDAQGRVVAHVQLAEIPLREFARRLSEDEYLSGNFGPLMVAGPDEQYHLDEVARDQSVAAMIKRKRSKNYAKPIDGEFWLVIWSVSGVLMGSAWRGGEYITSPAIANARAEVAESGVGPFDKIFFFAMVIRPELIWP
jgi:hypothetical protein